MIEIKIQIKDNVFSLTIGRNTKWYQDTYFIRLTREDYDDSRNVAYAESLFSLFREKYE